MSNVSDRVAKTRNPSNIIDVYSAADLGIAAMAADGVMRVALILGASYRLHNDFVLPRLLVPKVVTPGITAVTHIIGERLVTLLCAGDSTPHIWGRDIAGLDVFNVQFVDISNGGAGRGTVLYDLVGGNGNLSLLTIAKGANTFFKRIGCLVDVNLAAFGPAADFGNERGWVIRSTTATAGSHGLFHRRFQAPPFFPDNRSAALAFVGDVQSVTIAGNAVEMGKPANSFLHIDSASATGSYSIVGQNYRGVALDGEFFRPTLVTAITAQADASIVIADFADSAANPGVDTTLNFGVIVDLVRGQFILIADEAAYDGLHEIVRVADDQMSVDINVAHSTSGAGTLALTEHTVASNKYVRDETVTISGTTSYNGTAQIIRGTDTTIVLPQAFVADDASGTATSTGRDQDSPGVGTLGNGAQADSIALGEICWNGNGASTSVADGTYQVLNITPGVVSLASDSRFIMKDAATAEFTYTGLRPFSGTLFVNIAAEKAGASLASYRITFSVNQAVPVFASAPYSTLDLRDTTVRAIFLSVVDLEPGDDLRIDQAGDGTTTAMTVIEGQIIIRS